ncbi:MAG: hypothetical protein RH917_20230 [Lacipirellulaceae bacterium]
MKFQKRFSLKVVLVLVAIVALVCSWYVKNEHDFFWKPIGDSSTAITDRDGNTVLVAWGLSHHRWEDSRSIVEYLALVRSKQGAKAALDLKQLANELTSHSLDWRNNGQCEVVEYINGDWSYEGELSLDKSKIKATIKSLQDGLSIGQIIKNTDK